MTLAASLNDWDFASFEPLAGEAVALDLAGHCESAEAELTMRDRTGDTYEMTITEECERLRWFLLPQEASAMLAAESGEAVAIG